MSADVSVSTMCVAGQEEVRIGCQTPGLEVRFCELLDVGDEVDQPQREQQVLTATASL